MVQATGGLGFCYLWKNLADTKRNKPFIFLLTLLLGLPLHANTQLFLCFKFPLFPPWAGLLVNSALKALLEYLLCNAFPEISAYSTLPCRRPNIAPLSALQLSPCPAAHAALLALQWDSAPLCFHWSEIQVHHRDPTKDE